MEHCLNLFSLNFLTQKSVLCCYTVVRCGGIEQFESIERLQYYACKRFMNVTLKASSFGGLGDCGRYPLYITTFKQVIKYWIKILRMPSHRYVKKMP